MKGITVCEDGEKSLRKHLSGLKSNKKNKHKQKKATQFLLRILFDNLCFRYQSQEEVNI